MRSFLVLAIFSISLAMASWVQGQSSGQREFIQSSSPTRSGGRVVSRSGPGQSVQTRTYRSSSGTATPQLNRLRGTASTTSTGEESSIRSNSTETETRKTFRPQDQVRTPYPYPATTAPRTAQIPTNSNSSFASRNWGRAYNPAVPTQLTTPRLAQNCNCAPGFQTPLSQPPASLTPSLGGVQGGAVDPAWNNNLNLQFPPLNTSVQSGNAFQNWWNPIASGSGAYQPILRLQNMPPGTYLGQGIIGQPTAYVDGQPFRNLLRYISP